MSNESRKYNQFFTIHVTGRSRGFDGEPSFAESMLLSILKSTLGAFWKFNTKFGYHKVNMTTLPTHNLISVLEEQALIPSVFY